MTFLSLVIREYIASGPHSNEAANPSKDVSRLFIVTCLFADKAFISPKRRSSFSAASIKKKKKASRVRESSSSEGASAQYCLTISTRYYGESIE